MIPFDPHAQRRFAMEVVEGLRARGFEAFWAGGCVRDQLLGRTPKDYDVATNAKPDEIREVFGRRRTLALGAAFGVITVLGPKTAGQIEVATFRRDMAYSDGRHPDAVAFSTAEYDAQRRDFTINGLFYDPLSDEVIDFVDGKRDLESRVVRAIGDARQRFSEDKLRMLRGVRFAASYAFELDGDTAEAISAMADEVTIVSVERIAAELRLMLCGAARVRALTMLANVKLLGVLLPEVTGGQMSNAWQQTMAALGALEQPSFALALATLLARYVDGAAGETIARRWKLPNTEIHRLQWLLDHRDALLAARGKRWSALQSLLICPGASELIVLHQAMYTSSLSDEAQYAALVEWQGDFEFCRRMHAQPSGVLNPAPLLTGDDLVRHGVPRGPVYQELLGALRTAQLEEQIHSRAEAVALLEQLLKAKT